MAKKRRTKDVEPSRDAVKRARQAAVLKRLSEDEEYFRPISAWLDHVLFFYGGYYVRFEFYYGAVCRRDKPGARYRYLSLEDFTILRKLAEDLMDAVVRGMHESNERRKEAAARKPKKKKSPEVDPNQGRLI